MKLSYAILFGLFGTSALALPLQAQITIDGTTNTILDNNGNSITINGGDRAGDNLFHSFQEFSVINGGEAFFNNAADISNIFSRVTGGNISNIDGLLRANGGANLFIINPAGIIFGEGASLDIGGSFFATTADSILFSDDIEFSAVDRDNPPLLTINQPIGLVLGDNAGAIVNQSVADDVGLQVSPGNNLTLVGGDIEFNSGTIFAPGANIELGGLLAAGEIAIDADGSLNFPEDLARADVILTNGADINVQAEGGGNITIKGNNIEVSSGELGKSFLTAGISAESNSIEAQAGNLVLNATGDINISDSTVTNNVEESGIGNSGNININATNINITNGGLISADVFGTGNSGAITINTSDTISLSGEDLSGSASGISALVRESGTGNVGGIEIATANLSITKGSRIGSGVFGTGNARKIVINASNSISLTGETSSGFPSFIYSSIAPTGKGDTEGIEINASEVSFKEGAFLTSSVFGTGNTEGIKITASNNIVLDGEDSLGFASLIGSQVAESGIGDAGNIEITAANLSITNGAFLSTGSFGRGNAGIIKIEVFENLVLEGENSLGNPSRIASQVIEGEGNAGNIEIITANLSLTNSAFISASTFGKGDGGDIVIKASNTVSVAGQGTFRLPSAITTQVGNQASIGNAGDIKITTTSFDLAEGGFIASNTFGIGNAGQITIEALENITIDGQSFVSSPTGIFSRVEEDAIGEAVGIKIFTNNLSLTNGQIAVDSEGEASAGDLRIEANTLSLNNSSLLASTPVGEGGEIRLNIDNFIILRDNSSIIARAFESANGGNVIIDANAIVAFPNQNNDIIAAAEQGEGGRIDITTSAIFGIAERSSLPENLTNDLDASSEFGVAGTVTISEIETNPAQGLEELPTEVIDVASLVAQNLCQQGEGSEFILTGKGGIAASPSQTRDSTISEVNLVEPVLTSQPLPRPLSYEERGAINNLDKNSKEIVEAQGWVVNDRGQLELVAYSTDAVGSLPQPEYDKICPK